MIFFTGMPYFLDQIGVSISGVTAAFSFYRNTDYLKSNSNNAYFNNLIFYKAGTINNYDTYYDSTNTYALWVYIYGGSPVYTFSYKEDIGKDTEYINNFYDVFYETNGVTPVTTYDPNIQISGPFLKTSAVLRFYLLELIILL